MDYHHVRWHRTPQLDNQMQDNCGDVRKVSLHTQTSFSWKYVYAHTTIVDYKFNKRGNVAAHVAKIEMMAQNLEDLL